MSTNSSISYDRPSPVNPIFENISTQIDDNIVLTAPVNDLKRKLYVDGHDEDTIKRVMQRRRTLKSRIYTRKCRAKCRTSVQDMRKERENLIAEKSRITLEICLYKNLIVQCGYSC
ncbi:hypothetical protein LOD99_2766 [Oopsacas minuta]|uniref:Basic leucine zipper domain-containing protein n=1 Tax=Oopsacas minuta TaxID=111878 RepID=A0AAV7K0Z7_9METZ|nr:hypothetical protein LOD99_2766 [Oopsacas minuta]